METTPIDLQCTHVPFLACLISEERDELILGEIVKSHRKFERHSANVFNSGNLIFTEVLQLVGAKNANIYSMQKLLYENLNSSESTHTANLRFNDDDCAAFEAINRDANAPHRDYDFRQGLTQAEDLDLLIRAIGEHKVIKILLSADHSIIPDLPKVPPVVGTFAVVSPTDFMAALAVYSSRAERTGGSGAFPQTPCPLLKGTKKPAHIVGPQAPNYELSKEGLRPSLETTPGEATDVARTPNLDDFEVKGTKTAPEESEEIQPADFSESEQLNDEADGPEEPAVDSRPKSAGNKTKRDFRILRSKIKPRKKRLRPKYRLKRKQDARLHIRMRKQEIEILDQFQPTELKRSPWIRSILRGVDPILIQLYGSKKEWMRISGKISNILIQIEARTADSGMTRAPLSCLVILSQISQIRHLLSDFVIRPKPATKKKVPVAFSDNQLDDDIRARLTSQELFLISSRNTTSLDRSKWARREFAVAINRLQSVDLDAEILIAELKRIGHCLNDIAHSLNTNKMQEVPSDPVKTSALIGNNLERLEKLVLSNSGD